MIPNVNDFPSRWTLALREKVVESWDQFTSYEQGQMLRGEILPQWDIGL